MTESRMRLIVMSMLQGHHPTPIENCVGVGTPDLNFTRGWLELKQIARWPARGGIVQCKHFTAPQRMWLRRHCAAGGKAGLLVYIGPYTWLLLGGVVAADVFGKVSEADLYEVAALVSTGVPDPDLFLERFEQCC